MTDFNFYCKNRIWKHTYPYFETKNIIYTPTLKQNIVIYTPTLKQYIVIYTPTLKQIHYICKLKH